MSPVLTKLFFFWFPNRVKEKEQINITLLILIQPRYFWWYILCTCQIFSLSFVCCCWITSLSFFFFKHGSLNGYHKTHALRERARKLSQGILIIRLVFQHTEELWINVGWKIDMGFHCLLFFLQCQNWHMPLFICFCLFSFMDIPFKCHMFEQITGTNVIHSFH